MRAILSFHERSDSDQMKKMGLKEGEYFNYICYHKEIDLATFGLPLELLQPELALQLIIDDAKIPRNLIIDYVTFNEITKKLLISLQEPDNHIYIRKAQKMGWKIGEESSDFSCLEKKGPCKCTSRHGPRDH